MPWLTGVVNDFRLGARALGKNPGFSTAAMTMLAVSIGINATVFTVTNAVLFKGFPAVEGNDRLMYISNGGCCISYPDFEDIRAQAKSFSEMGITHGVASVVSDGSGFPERVEVTEVSSATFRTVGRKPILGRDFAAADEIAGAAPVAMLSYGFWERRYAKDPSIVGRSIRMNGALTTVIGVMPAGLSFPQTVDTWIPLAQTARVKNRENTDTWFAFGRLADGVTFESARAEVETIIRRLETDYPVTDLRQHLVVQRFRDFFIGPNAVALYGSMWGAVGFVLLIACANLANLLLARAIGGARDISVRIALGAARWRIMRQLLVESVMLSSLGGTLGWWIAKWGVRSYAAAMANKSSWLIIDYRMDNRVLAYLIAISIGTGILFGLAPALRLSKLDVNTALKDGSRGATSGGRGKRLSAVLVTGEMALAVVLLAGAGVMIRSFLKIHNSNMGIDPDNLLAGAVTLPQSRYTGDQTIAFSERLLMRVSAMPGVESAALAESLPSAGAAKYTYELERGPAVEYGSRPSIGGLKISPNYFRTVRATVLAGREFGERDVASSAPVAIVNRLFAENSWPGEDPIGKRIRLFNDKSPDAWRTVVGVVSNIVQRDINRQRADPIVYLPYAQKPGPYIWVLARTRVRPGILANAFRREVQVLDSDLPLYGPFALSDRLERYGDSRFYGNLFLIFAAIALLLASIGLYTVVALSVRQRTQELGVRMAMGATPADILKLVFTEGMAPLGCGLAIGLAGSFAVNRVLQAALVRVSPSDPLTLVVSSGILIVAAMLGCWIPARRAMRVDPVVALRHE
ncbi:MAG: ABC transporter permease [Bryobacterales bacterium]|nr:ABC transporter permease [Bryobacterales bacterium]MBV9401498.1 ABC transporter permease [Bryobacterales bacterium]